MESPLWTDEFAPEISDLPQPDARDYFETAVDEPLNLVVHGPPGVGKTAAVRALAAAAHEDPDNDLVELNVADFFDRTKKEIKNDERFASFLRGNSRMSKRDMINHVLKESASYQPVSGRYKTVLLDNAEAIREDFQQALRRVMERYAENTQFVIATRQPSKLIPPIRSRCFSVSMRAPGHDAMVETVERVVSLAGVEYDDDGLEYLAGYGDGNVREAVLGAQTTAEAEGEVTMTAAYETLGDIGHDDVVETMLEAAEQSNFEDARSELDTLIYDEGYDGDEILSDVLGVARSRYDGRRLAKLYRIAGEVDFDLTESTSDRVQLGHLLAEIGRPADE
ncbi:AAA family ATPase [Halosegnis rubeus]|mgnify:CR=1 FL=1|jgi:replication factor C small subunit|uniref:Replication factor C small subunit n=1 Tax=Halosegnis rubeus TaxID=2212850 RepID=A0A5N5UC62_9EURY|nr:AAA family ATPase [Halosegnis rubeus]KAB7515133.1 AAA family ATPase [Halosegnis rubeus]KAB7516183.1 AAA family ATPase [Halosegnis rubeus]KAB7517493.1 AAA family ATPase [Halosegnis rubeus]